MVSLLLLPPATSSVSDLRPLVMEASAFHTSSPVEPLQPDVVMASGTLSYLRSATTETPKTAMDALFPASVRVADQRETGPAFQLKFAETTSSSPTRTRSAMDLRAATLSASASMACHAAMELASHFTSRLPIASLRLTASLLLR